MRSLVRFGAVALAASLTLVLVTPIQAATPIIASTAAPASATTSAIGASSAASGSDDADWSLSTSTYSPNGEGGYVPAYLGNGYFAGKIPAEGTGFAATAPIPAEFQLAGFYGMGPGTTIQRANLPGWTTLGFSDGSGTYGNVPTLSECTFGHYCEAESGTLTGSLKIAKDHTGYTGTGFVAGFAANNNTPQRGSTDTVVYNSDTAGPADLVIRYAAALNTSAQTLSASVNGAAASTVTMPAQPNWNTWATAVVPVTVVAGRNTLAISCGATDTCVVNVDSVALTATGTAPLPVATSASTVSDYQQTVDMKNGSITTSLTWTSPAGNATRLTYQDFVSEADAHVAAVRMTVQPIGWSGTATIDDAFDGRATTIPVSHRTTAAINLTNTADQSLDGAAHQIRESLSTVGLGMTAAIASTLVVDGNNAPTTPLQDVLSQSLGQQASLQVTDGTVYTATKYVGIASGTDTAIGSAPLAVSTAPPLAAATEAATAAGNTGWDSLQSAHQAAWAKLWTASITIPGDSDLTRKARMSMFNLLESARPGVEWSMSPGGLSADDYNGHVFWDAETWMYPALLAAHPDLAETVNDYRSTLLGPAQVNANTKGYAGAQFPWESAESGNDVGVHPNEIHINGDIALAQWDYYQATGDLGWLKSTGWPVLQSIAHFWVSRATPNTTGGYDLKGVQPPDEDVASVTDSAYTNVAALTSLQIATKAATLVGATIDPTWATVATGLASTIPFDPTTNTHPEYSGYKGGTVNQADVVMMQYPWNFPMPADVAQADLDYYTPRTATSGPAMTDSINMIDTAALSTPGCSSYTYFQRSIDPYLDGPLDQFSEHVGTTGVIDFTTGIGGFLQELYYGFTGMRWNTTSVTLDPMLPPQLPGLQLTAVHWQGRTFDIDIEPDTTTITLESGDPMPVVVAGTAATVSSGTPLVVPTRRPDLTPTADAARCQGVTATSADLAHPADAANDGASGTSWQPTSAGASLTLDLGKAQSVRHVQVLSATGATTAYSIDTSTDGTTWSPLASVAADASNATSSIDPGVPVPARYVRYTAAAGVMPRVSTLSISTVTPVPAAPIWTDACGVDNNGSFSGYTDTAQYSWKVTDHSTLDGKVGIVVTPADGFVFPAGARTQWTKVQDNSPCMIAVPAAPIWTDACGVDDNGSFSGYADTSQYSWKVTDHSTLDGKVGIVVTAADGFAFPAGARVQWTQVQDNSRCAASITATTTAQTCAVGVSVPGSLTLDETGIRVAYVYVGAVTGTKAGDLSKLAPGQYLIIATAADGSAFNTVPPGWKASPTTDADGNTVKVSRVVTVGATNCATN